MKIMSKDQIPKFVQAVADTGCNITAVLEARYVIGDSDLPREAYEVAAPQLKEISEKFGKRDHLLSEIADYLVSIGRYFPKEESSRTEKPHWAGPPLGTNS
jgi:hypothetical protein